MPLDMIQHIFTFIEMRNLYYANATIEELTFKI